MLFSSKTCLDCVFAIWDQCFCAPQVIFGNFGGLGPHLGPEEAQDPKHVRFVICLSLTKISVEISLEHAF